MGGGGNTAISVSITEMYKLFMTYEEIPSAETLATTIPITRKWFFLGMCPLMPLHMLYASEPLIAVFAR